MDSGPVREGRFLDVFGPGRHVFLVVHATDLAQTERNTRVAVDCGAAGVFLINHDGSSARVLDWAMRVRDSTDAWVGVNCLDLDPASAVAAAARHDLDGVWVDHSGVSDSGPDHGVGLVADAVASGRALYFGGVAFKYGPRVADPAAAAAAARGWMDVVTTSGPGTGLSADPGKVAAMAAAAAPFPLGLASGITAANVGEYPDVAALLVATGVSLSFTETDPDALAELISRLR